LEVNFKKKGEKKHAYETPYTIDEDTGEFSAEIGILGFKFKQTTIIKDGKFTLSMPILSKQLVMKFAVK
jgi:2',3'-cyclic-nucleotide 2'-phosphodiesterase (5'-nucleotidase family)